MKKRILSLLLCFCMIASTAVLFSSCGKKDIDLSKGYTVVYGRDMSATVTEEVKAFVQKLKEKSSSIESKRVNAEDELADESKYEILVGNTNRPETGKLLEKVNGQGYAIATVGKKIVIVGTTNFLTAQALEYFSDTYLSGELDNFSLKIEETIVSNVEMLEITGKWGFVYSSYLTEVDKIVQQLQDIKAGMSNYSDVRGMFLRSEREDSSESAVVLVGTVDRAETKTFLSGMDANNYGVGAKNGKILISAYNDAMMSNAFEIFSDLLRDSVYVDGEKKRILVPADFSRIYTDTSNKDIITDFPRPQGLTLVSTIDVHSALTEYCYNGDGVTQAAYQAYCNDLIGAGYALYTDHTVESSMFRTYVNQQKGVMIYVAFNAYAHAATDVQKVIRVIVGPTEKANMLPADMLTLQSFNSIAVSSVTAVRPSYANSGKGQVYVVTLENGSFIMIDGGVADPLISDRIYAVLEQLFIKSHGYAPSREDPIRIAAWYVTHGHSDHYASMPNFINKYCRNSASVTIDTLIANFASDEEYYGSESGDSPNTTLRDTMAELSSKVSDVAGEEPGFKYIKVHTGQKFWLANVECEVLYTHEDLLPNRLHSYNDSSTVIRMMFYHTQNGSISEGSKPTSFIWLGDAYKETCNYLSTMYGSYLKSDMVQVSHHSGAGSDPSLYKLIAPTAAWFPTYLDAFKTNITNSSTTLYKICNQVTSIQYVIMSDMRNYTVSITATGANYDIYSVNNPMGVFSAGENMNRFPVTVSAMGKDTTSGFMRR